MTPNAPSSEGSALKKYILNARDAAGERMNDHYFWEASDELAKQRAAAHLGIPELSECYFETVGAFSLRLEDGPTLFPIP